MLFNLTIEQIILISFSLLLFFFFLFTLIYEKNTKRLISTEIKIFLLLIAFSFLLIAVIKPDKIKSLYITPNKINVIRHSYNEEEVRFLIKKVEDHFSSIKEALKIREKNSNKDLDVDKILNNQKDFYEIIKKAKSKTHYERTSLDYFVLSFNEYLKVNLNESLKFHHYSLYLSDNNPKIKLALQENFQRLKMLENNTSLKYLLLIDYTNKHDSYKELVKLANLLYENKSYKEAKKTYYEALTLNPDLTEVYLSLGNIYIKENNIEQAIKKYKKVLMVTPTKKYSIFSFFSDLIDSKLYLTQLEKIYKDVIMEHSNYGILYFQLANVLRAQGKNQEAIKFDNKAILYDNDPNLMIINYYSKFDNIIKFLENKILEDIDEPDYYYTLAKILEYKNNNFLENKLPKNIFDLYKKAKELYEKKLLNDKNNLTEFEKEYISIRHFNSRLALELDNNW